MHDECKDSGGSGILFVEEVMDIVLMEWAREREFMVVDNGGGNRAFALLSRLEKIMSHRQHRVNFFASDLCLLSPHLKILSQKQAKCVFWNNIDDPKL